MRVPQLNESSPAARGLIHAWPMYDAGAQALFDVSGRGPSARINGSTTTMYPTGGPLAYGSFSGGANERITFGSQGYGAEYTWNVDGNIGASMVVIAQLRSTAARAVLVGDFTSAGGAQSLFFEAQAAGDWRLSFGSLTANGGTTDLAPHCFIGTRFGYGDRVAVFVDGVEIGSNASAGTGLAGSQMAVGAGLYSGSINWDGWVYDLRMYNRAMYDDEVQWHSRRENWFAAYEQPERRHFVVPAAGGVDEFGRLTGRSGLTGYRLVS